MAEKSTKAHFVFKKYYSQLGSALGTNLSVVVSELYSSNLISLGTKDKVTSDASTPTIDKALAVLNDVESRLSGEHVLEVFLNVLSCDLIDLGHIAEPMRSEYQHLCEKLNPSTERSNLVVGKENSCFVAPGLSQSSQANYRRIDDADSSLLAIDESQESRPKHLHFSDLAEGRTVGDPAVQSSSQSMTSMSTTDNSFERSVVPFGISATTTPVSSTTAQCKGELQRWFKLYLDGMQEDNRKHLEEQFEEQLDYVKKDYELKCTRLESKVSSLLDTVDTYSAERSAQKEKICEMEKELSLIHKEFAAKSQEVEALRKTLADRETELEKVKNLMYLKQEKLQQLKSGEDTPTDSPMTKNEAKLQMYKRQIALCEEVHRILVQLRNCPPDDIDSLTRELKEQVEKISESKKRRFNTL